ncbi:hypothetical protein MAPG_08137 [Magnaporthiopsis poae ATCC 64411]|uniref:Uncharacterized protein n=1 Tax=Magnaporthiopsis poae (strain ATCC 64411 / 73-15) TaxID=644358 RepID=A0A0C4E6J5_MAGP6|nr:hypothetical protein MAPG_08137 [Magnaporthiopsis poae ATCC 64411]
MSRAEVPLYFYLKDTRVVRYLEESPARPLLLLVRAQENRTTEKIGTAPDRHHPNVQSGIAGAPGRTGYASIHRRTVNRLLWPQCVLKTSPRNKNRRRVIPNEVGIANLKGKG